MPEHDGRHRSRKASPATVFQSERNFARDIAIGNGGTDAVVSWRLGQAWRADRPRRCIQRYVTQRAAIAGQEIEGTPAVVAETVISLDDCPTPRTARGQCKSDGRAEPAGTFHMPLVAGNAARHKRRR